MSTQGTFVWHDLMTHDVAAAKAFYGPLIGWEVRESGGWQLILNGGKDMGTMMTLDKSQGLPSHWMGYVQVDDLDAAVGRATRCGGKLCVGPHDIPNVGRFAVLTDPAGTPISAFQYTAAKERSDEYPVGSFCWNELMTKDPAAVTGFYGEVFGWSTAQMDMGPMGMYTLFKFGDKQVAGCMALPPGVEMPAHWMHYIHVADVDATFRRAQEMGATVLMQPMDLAGIGRFANLLDPAGAPFAIFRPERPAT